MDEIISINKVNNICLGIQGENNAKTVRIDVREWLKEFPNGIFYVTVKRPTEGTYYTPSISLQDGILHWTITNVDNAIAGTGTAEIRLMSGDVLKKSTMFRTCIEKCMELGDGPVPPTPTPSWIEQLIQQVAENTEDIEDIQEVIPSDATAQNKLATQSYVETHGGKIDVIAVDGVDQPIVNKRVNIELPEIPEAPIQSISLGGVPQPPDQNGNVALPAYPTKQSLGVDTIEGNIETLSTGLQEAEQAIQELTNDLDGEVTRATGVEGQLTADIDETNDRIDTEIQDRTEAVADLQDQIDNIQVPVTSVNSKTGDVVLNATDIKLTTNQQTVQNNFIRIDEEVERVDEAKLDKTTPTAEGTFLYSATMEGQGTVEATNTPTADKIPLYDANGNIKSSTPVANNDVLTKDYGDSRYAPLTYVSNLYGSIYLGGQTVRLIDNKPTAGQYNFLTSISTNTEYNWSSPTITFDRVIENPIDLANTNSLTFTLKYKTDRTATISWGAKVQCSTNGQTWEDISTQQSFNAVTVQQGAGTSTDITVFTDSVVGVRRLETGNYLRILLFKKQESATSLSTDIYFGVMVDNAYVCTYAQFNFLSVTIDTTQIKDGSVTYQKLSENVQQTIDSKLDKVTIADGNIRTYTIEANGTQNYRRATPSATNNAVVLRDGSGRAKFSTPVDDLDATNKSYVDTGLSGKQDTIDSTHKLPSSYVSGLATVATSGSYNDLSNKPTIPTVNNGTLTIQKNGTTVGTFGANQSGNTTANIEVPTALSELSADSTHRTVTDAEKTAWNNKQDELESGVNIKTVNGQSLLGSGNIEIQGGGGIAQNEVVDRRETLPQATASSADFVEVGSVLYVKTKYIAWDEPTITLSGDVVTTPIVEGVTKYKMYANGTYIGYVDSNNTWHGEVSE